MHGGLDSEMMIIVEHEDQLVLDMFEHLIDQYIYRTFRILVYLGCFLLQVGECRLPEAGNDLLDSMCDVTEEGYRVGVSVIELIPDNLFCPLTYEIGDQRGFS